MTRRTELPLELEEALYKAARAVVGDAPLATSTLVKAIIDRSERYTSDRARLSSPADPIADLAARAVFFTATDAMKIALPLHELARRGALPGAGPGVDKGPVPVVDGGAVRVDGAVRVVDGGAGPGADKGPVRVVDVGAGCGAMSLGALTMLGRAEIVAIDRDAKALAIAATAIRDFVARASAAAAATSTRDDTSATRGGEVTFTTRTGDVTKAEIPACDLVFMGTLLNELPPDKALALVERALAAIGDDGAVIIIEPALRVTSRALHAIRDALVAHVFAPCTRRVAPCTALADPGDWCHEDRPLALPPRTAELARLTHLRDGGMKFSYLVLRNTPLALVEHADAWRIVSAPRIAKGKLELIGCSDAGRSPLRLLKRNRTQKNKELERADRGDVVAASDTPDEDRVEIRGPIERITLDR